MKYNTSRFRGINVAMNACFNSKGELNPKALKQLSRWYVDKGVQGLYICGSTGEGLLLSVEERKQTLEAIAEEVGNELTMIVHVGAPATKDSVELAAHAQACGAHATSAVPSIFYRYSEASIETHWNAITEAADIPFFIYNIPATTGYNLSDALLDRMLKNERVCGIKNSAEVAYQIAHIRARAPEGFVIFNGPDEQYVAGRMMGADGGIGGTYGPMPELYLALEELIVQGRWDEAFSLQKDVLALIERLLSFPSMYGANKAIIYLRSGIDIGKPRLPFLPVSPDDPDLRALCSDIESLIQVTEKKL
jgi:N-acetylneuraminate lyase